MIRVVLLCAVLIAPLSPAVAVDGDDGDLGFQTYLEGSKRIKCLYGYVASKTGNHAAAVKIYEDCIARWDDVYSYINLARLYEEGRGVPKDLRQAASLMQRGASQPEKDGYAPLARYYWGVMLVEGKGVTADRRKGEHWLQQAASEGVGEATDYLAGLPAYSQ
ncbi:tetratricopeptide repeat protein [Pseudomonas sp.]|uniref:tetratricopeptide repeat protein n=1 Tax=Pseudomonas sp. TaxID=306 RepID=UPI00272959D6|nr:sel1 repeat family protein [Pseudomonas sp.]